MGAMTDSVEAVELEGIAFDEALQSALQRRA
jgi:hypothetical protein